MFDPFVLLAPILLLPVIALLRFIGCQQILGVEDVTYGSSPPAASLKIRINCGGPSLGPLPGEPAGTLPWTGDAALASGGQSQANTLGNHVKDPVTNQDVTGDIYETCRLGASFSYAGLPLSTGDYKVTLKFAVIENNSNIIGVFRYQINGVPKTIDSAAMGLGFKLDATQTVHIDSSGTLTLTFEEDQPAHGVLAFVNAIEVGG